MLVNSVAWKIGFGKKIKFEFWLMNFHSLLMTISLRCMNLLCWKMSKKKHTLLLTKVAFSLFFNIINKWYNISCISLLHKRIQNKWVLKNTSRPDSQKPNGQIYCRTGKMYSSKADCCMIYSRRNMPYSVNDE